MAISTSQYDPNTWGGFVNTPTYEEHKLRNEIMRQQLDAAQIMANPGTVWKASHAPVEKGLGMSTIMSRFNIHKAENGFMLELLSGNVNSNSNSHESKFWIAADMDEIGTLLTVALIEGKLA